MIQNPLNTESSWLARVRRAVELQPQGVSDEVWRLYVPTLNFQSELAKKGSPPYQPDLDFRCQIDFELLANALNSLLSIALEHGPRLLRERAQHLQSFTREELVQNFRSYVKEDGSQEYETDAFFFRACLQPIAENLQVQVPADQNQIRSRCPVCGSVPQLAFLRAVGEGSAAWLQCSFCLREWEFRRLVCISCGEEEKEKLPRFSSQEPKAIHVFACDSCKHYLKAVDTTIDGRAVPLVDEVASALLDCWATERNYIKMVRNLMGF